MTDNLAIFLVLLVSVIAAAVLTLTSMRGRYRLREAALKGGAAAEAAALTSENSKLNSQVRQLEERLRVLERIATDPAERTAREIEQLRS
jgi:hypothetical protein